MILCYVNHSWKRLDAFQFAHGSQPQAFLNPLKKRRGGGIRDFPKDHHFFYWASFLFLGNWRFVWNFQVIHSLFLFFFLWVSSLGLEVVVRRFGLFFFLARNIHLWWTTFGSLPDALKPCRGALWPDGACHQPDTEQKISSPNLQAGHILVSVGGLHLLSLGKWWAQDAWSEGGWGTWLVPGSSNGQAVGMWNNVKAACFVQERIWKHQISPGYLWSMWLFGRQ